VTRRARIAVLTMALAVLASAPAAAQRDEAEPVVGGGSFNDAPGIGGGTYSDSILLGETLLYRVPVAAGQRLTVTVSLDDADAIEAAGLFSLYPNLYTPLRELAQRVTGDGGGSAFLREAGEERSRALDKPLGSVERAGDASGVYAGPGVWYVGFTASGTSPTVEVPFTFTVAVEGRPVEPLPGPESLPQEPEEEPVPPARGDAEAGDGDSDVLRALGVLVGGLVLGVGSGTVAAFVSRRPKDGG
jgi:Ca-activated chloride channel family protein